MAVGEGQFSPSEKFCNISNRFKRFHHRFIALAGPMSPLSIARRKLPERIPSRRGRSEMERWLFKWIAAATIILPTLSGVAWAGGSDDFGCSNATLKGEYAFGITDIPRQVFQTVHHLLRRASRSSTAAAGSLSAITGAIAFERQARPISPRKGRKPAPTSLIPTVRAA